jgi:hypothetical protein
VRSGMFAAHEMNAKETVQDASSSL